MTFDELYNTYRHPIYLYLYRRVQSHEQAEDLVQEVFLRAWRHISTVRNVSYQAWLYRIAHNLYIDVNTRNRLIAWCNLPEEHEDFFSACSIESHEDITIRRLDLQSMLSQLTDVERNGLALWLQGKEEYGVGIKQAAHRARSTLARIEREGPLDKTGKKRKQQIA